MRKSILVALILAMLCSMACAESVYEEIQMSDTLETITERYGEGEEYGEYTRLGDALLSFYESGRLRAKSVFFEDIHEVAALTQGDFEPMRKLRQGASMDELTKALGEGAEILMFNLSDEDDAGTRMLLAWRNEAGDVFEALFEAEDGKWVLFAIGEISD